MSEPHANPPSSPGAPAPRSRVSASFVFGPLGDVSGNLAAVLAESLGLLLALFYPPVICKKTNIVVTELVQNVMENIRFPASEMRVALSIDDARILIRATNRVTREQEAQVAARLRELESLDEAKKLFAQTIRQRRAERLKGGLGLMRLVSENKFRLGSEYDGDELTVSAEFSLKEPEK
jgi:Family of unknown function (DUF6272)